MIPFLHIGIAFSFFTIIFFLFRRKLRLENILASAFLFFLAMPIFIKLVSTGLLNIPLPQILLSIQSYPFTFGPFLYLYAKAEIDAKFAFKKIYLLHFVPFLLFAFLPFVFPALEPFQPVEFMKHGNHIGQKFVDAGMPPPPPFQGRPGMPGMQPGLMPPDDLSPIKFEEPERIFPVAAQIPVVFIILSFIIYTVLVFLLLKKHKKIIKDYFSYDSIKLNLKWLQWIILCFAVSYTFVFLSSQIIPEIYMHPMLNPGISPDIATTFFILVFCFFAIKQPVIFKNIDILNGADTNNIVTLKETKKYKKSGLKDTEAVIYIDKLETMMKCEKLYLNGDLTIEDVSKKLDIPRHYLTQILNEKLNKNFFMFVNEYRIQEAKLMMEDQKFKDYTIIRIACDSGFNSKSGFNIVFKKLTGYTPSEYRKNILLNSQILS